MSEQKFPDPGTIDFENMTDEEFEAFERTTLMAPEDLAEEIMEIKKFIGNDEMVNDTLLPRFGLLTLKARRTPMYVYGHPKLKERFPKSFNDGKHIFISDDFMRKLLEAEAQELKVHIPKEKAFLQEEGQRRQRGMPARSMVETVGQPKEGVVPLILHHLMHMIMNHHNRFRGFPPEFSAIGADISVYSKLRLAFPHMRWLSEIEESFPASKLSMEDLKKYSKLSEESIIREVAGNYRSNLPEPDENFSDEQGDQDPQSDSSSNDGEDSDSKSQKDPKKKDKKKDPKDKNDKDSNSEDGDGDPDSDSDSDNDSENSKNDGKKKDKPKKGEPGEGDPGDPGDGEPGEGEPGEGDGEPMDKEAMAKALQNMGMKLNKAQKDELDGDSDTINMKQMTMLAEEAGISTTKERLEIPEPWDYSKIEAIEKETRLADISDITKSVKIAGQAGTMGGGHLAGDAHEEVLKETEGKLSWKMGLQEMLGDTMKYRYSEAEAGDLWYVDPADMGLDQEIFIGADLPHKTEGAVMVLLDTSGSITEDLFKMFMSEIFGLIKNENPESSTASEVVLLFVDDVIRGEPVIINEANYEELSSNKFNVFGRGGNDIGGTIQTASKLPMFEEKKITGIIYFTDLGDAPPTKKDVPEGVPMVFVCPPDNYQEEFIKAVKGFARVYPIEEGLEVDLTRDGYLSEDGGASTPKTKKRKFGF